MTDLHVHGNPLVLVRVLASTNRLIDQEPDESFLDEEVRAMILAHVDLVMRRLGETRTPALVFTLPAEHGNVPRGCRGG